MVLQVVLAVLLSGVGLSTAQSCGTLTCSQEYDDDCQPDTSCALYDNCLTSQSNCADPIAPVDNLSVDCYETCIIGSPSDPTVPFQCCADSILVTPEPISLTNGTNFIIARLFSPNEDGMSIYRHNTFCKYNIQCPSEDYVLHYTMVNFNIEPPYPDASGTCLDFLRYDFTDSGVSVPKDACGELDDLDPVLKSGTHGSGLTLDFRSNRINRTEDFFLAIICIFTPSSSQSSSSQAISSSSSLKESVNPSLSATEPTIKPALTDQQRTDCIPSQSIARTDVSIKKLTTAEDYLRDTFPGVRQPLEGHPVTVTRAGAVTFLDKTITVVERSGNTLLYKFENIEVLQVYNRIEGNLTFVGGSSPRGRTFPGHGFLQVDGGAAQFVQTLADPIYLLSDEEEVIVRTLFEELFNRQAFDAERFYFSPPSQILTNPTVNCDVNTLAKLNSQSCTTVVKAVANFFLKTDPFQDFCAQGGV